MDDGAGGDYTTVLGSEETALKTRYTAVGLKMGAFYRFKCRVRNKIGWSEWSTDTLIQAADKPAKPLPPKLVSATATEINLQFFVPSETGSSALTGFKLFMNDGDDSNEADTHVISYTSNSLLHTLTAADDGLEAGKIYKFRFVATNAIGNSAYSDTVRFAAVDAPTTPNAPTILQ